MFTDIKVKEPNLDAMMRGKVVFEPPRFMTVAQAVNQLLQIINAQTTDGISKSFQRLYSQAYYIIVEYSNISAFLLAVRSRLSRNKW